MNHLHPPSSRIDGLVAGLRARRIGGGDVVLARLSDPTDLAAVILACRRVGAGLALLPAGGAGANLSLARAGITPVLEVAADAVTPDALAMADPGEGPGAAHDAPVIWPTRPDPGAALVRTTLDQVLAQAHAMAARLRLGPGDVVAINADAAHPMAVVAALATVMVGAVIAGGTGDTPSVAIIPDADDLDAVLEGFDAETLRLVVTDAARVPPDLHGPVILNAWTMAEVGGLATLCDPADPAESARRTRGRRMPGVEVMIVDPATGLDRLLLEPGEVWLRAWPRPGATQGRRARSDPAGSDGFVRTGRIGMLDPEGRLILEDAARR